jgi:preprotein translocase subunit SecG
MSILIVLCYILFVLAAIVLIVVVLLQEGRGGGFGEALGVHGRETFGVGSKGINTFTAWTAAAFLASALVIHWLNQRGTERDVFDEDPNAPADVVPVTPGAGEAGPPPGEAPPPPDGG